MVSRTGDGLDNDFTPKNWTPSRPSRRDFLATVATAGMTSGMVGIAGCLGSGENTIKIGALTSRSGWEAFVGEIAYHGVELAVDDIEDEAGGILDREIELIAPDPGSDTSTYQSLTERLILEDEVDVLTGVLSSASREAVRPIIEEHQQLYFYWMNYEGGVCDTYNFLTGPAVTQNVEPLVEFMNAEFGPQCYIISADYVFGQVASLWARFFLNQLDGEVVGEEFVPQQEEEFGSIINDIRRVDPDWIMTMLVTPENASFWIQAEAEGLEYPYGSPSNISVGFEHKTLSAPALEEMYFTTNYAEEIDTPENREFVEHWRDNYPNEPYVNLSGYSSYLTVQLYANAVEAAGSVDQETVHNELETGTSVSVAGMDAAVHPPSHHLSLDIQLGRVDSEHDVEFLESYSDVTPTDVPGDECHLDTESSWDDPISRHILPEADDL